MADAATQVQGVREVQRILRQLDRKALRQTQAAMRQAASPLVSQARALTPQVSPLSGWAHTGRTGWRESQVLSGVKVATGGRAIRANQTWPLLTITQSTPAGMIYDWAGRAGRYMKRPESAFVGKLPKLGTIKGSKYSRVLFPAFVASRGEVIGAVLDAIDQVARQVNVEITRV